MTDEAISENMLANARPHDDGCAVPATVRYLRCSACLRTVAQGPRLFRQQALAEGIAASGKYDLVVSCLATDERNQALNSCLKATGVPHIRQWGDLFDGKACNAVFSHQKWVSWVRGQDTAGRWSDWLDYVERRYGYVS